MNRKRLTVFGLVVGIFAMVATLAYANELTGAGALADCNGYTLTVNAQDLNPGGTYFVNYFFFCGTTAVGSGTITFTAGTGTGPDSATGTGTATDTWSGGPLTTNCAINGYAILTSNGAQFPITVSTPLNCSTTGNPKSFSIGPSSMEGDLHIAPGDWISGGYNFKFTSGSHAATMYNVTATITVPVSCPDHSTQNVVIPLGAPGQLNGGGVTTYTYNIAAGDTSNHATNDQNSILAWEGAVQAPATLCGGAIGRNQIGAVFNTTVVQTPHVGLVDWQFHYRDPNAKGKGNVNCTDKTNPKRNDAATCGASWSQTVRDP